MRRDLAPGSQDACDSSSEGMRFGRSHESRLEHPGVSDGN